MKKLMLATLLFSSPVLFLHAIAEQSALQLDEKNQNISLMRSKWRDNFIPNNNIDSKLLQLYINKLDTDSSGLWEKLNKNKSNIDLLWDDTPLKKSSTAGKLKLGANLYTVYQRLFTLAKAYKTPGSLFYNNQQLKLFISETLSKLNIHYYNNSMPEYGNWWHWELGISRVVNNIMIILYDDLDKKLITNYNRATKYFVKRPEYLAESSGAPYSSTKNTFLSTGGNRSDAATVVFVRGLLENNPKEIKAAVNSLPAVLDTVKSGDGFYEDYSFIQHKDLPYTGTYGQVLLKGLGLIKNSIAGTSLDFSIEDNKKLYSIINHSFIPWLYEGKMLDAVNGRSISRKEEQNRDVGIGVINALALFIDGAPEKEKEELLQTIKSQLNTSMIEYYRNKLPDSLIAYQTVNDIYTKNITIEKIHPQGYLYADMDRLLYKGNGFASVIAMHSKRVGSYECINGENIKGQRTADGMTYIYLSGNEDYYNYWPTVDSNHLPGTTSSGKIGKCDEQYRTGQLGHANIEWAGGVILDQYASASLNLKVPAHSLKAKKSWFLTPNMIVMLGDGISSNEPAVTTVDNRLIDVKDTVRVDNSLVSVGTKKSGATISLTENGKSIIYHNLDNQKATVDRTLNSADWSEIGTSSGKISGEFLKITQNHKKNNKYAWAIYPNAGKFLNNKPEVLANNTKVQAIKLPQDKVVYATFWRPAKIKDIKGLTPLSLILIPTTNGYKIAISSPRRDTRVSFQLNKKVSLSKDIDSRVYVKDNLISVNMKGLSGSAYVFELNNN